MSALFHRGRNRLRGEESLDCWPLASGGFNQGRLVHYDKKFNERKSLKFQQLRASQMRIVRESLDINHYNKASQVVVRTYE